MGRNNKKRQTATFVYAGKPVKAYQPTQGQLAAFGVAHGRGDGIGMLTTLHKITGYLIVDPAKWEWIQDTQISGEADFEEFARFVGDVMNHEWPQHTEENDAS
jgi:hypothetical protein